MVIKQFKKFAKDFKSEKLLVQEKTVMRDAVLSFVRDNPAVRNQGTGRLIFSRGLINNLKETKFMPVALIITLLVVISGGASLAAEQSLPGDLLYPVKVSINENIRSAVNFSNESKVDWEIDKVERRLEEIEKLKTKNKFDTRGSLKAKAEVGAQIAAAARLADRFQESEKSAAANSRLEAVLKGHAQVLLILSEDGNGTSEIILDILEDTKAIAESRIEAEDKIYIDNKTKFEAAANNKMKAANNKITEVKKTVNKFASSLSESTKIRVDAQLNSALAVYGEGKIKADEKSYNEAFVKFQEALRLAQEAQIIVNSANRLELDWQIQLDRPEAKSDEAQEIDRDPVNKEQIKNMLPVQIDSLIEAANKINARTRVEIKDDDKSDDNPAGKTDQPESDSKQDISIEFNGKVDSDSINLEGNLNL